jgi:hypothetical protein
MDPRHQLAPTRAACCPCRRAEARSILVAHGRRLGGRFLPCRREPCTGPFGMLPPGRACLSAWIEHRSGERAFAITAVSPRDGRAPHNATLIQSVAQLEAFISDVNLTCGTAQQATAPLYEAGRQGGCYE